MKKWPDPLHFMHGSNEKAFNSTTQYVKLEIRKYDSDPWILLTRKSVAVFGEEPAISVGFIPTIDEIKEIITHLQAILVCMEEPTNEYEQLIQNYI